jgi:hypothetical protein
MDWVRLVKAIKQRVFPAVRSLPAPVYPDLVVKWKQRPETVEGLRCVCQKTEVEGKAVMLIRVVDPVKLKQRGLKVREYADLDGHAEVVCYEGWFRYAPTLKVELTPVNPP